MDDMELLRGFTERGSESAFRGLVERHLPLVIGTARRITGDLSLAEEVAQAVFVLLARKACTLGSQTILPGWLYRTTCFVAIRARRSEQRRRRREQEAVTMQLPSDSDPLWEKVTPQLDDALGRLGHQDRNALVLHFFEKRSMREVGTATGVTEEAAKKRVQRALEKLRRLLGRRGIEIGTGALMAGLSQEGLQAAAAPALVSSISAAAMAPAPATTSMLVIETLKAWRWARIKAVLGLSTGLVAVALVVPLVLHYVHQPNPPSVLPGAQISAPATRSAPDNSVAAGQPAIGESEGQQPGLHPLAITVLDAVNGTPIAGADVRHTLMLSRGEGAITPLQTDAKGVVTFQVPRQFPVADERMSQFEVWVEAPGYASRTIMWLCTTGHVLSTVSSGYTVRLETGTTLSGTVLDENGAVLPGVRIGAMGNGYRGYSISTDSRGQVTSPPELRAEDFPAYHVNVESGAADAVATDRAGRFQLVHFPSDLRALVIELFSPDGVRQKFRTPEGKKMTADTLPEVSYPDLRQGTARLVLAHGMTVAGVVLDANNSPVAGATVTENRFQWGMYRPLLRVETDLSGRFILPNITRPEILIAAAAEGYATVLTAVTVKPGMAPVRIQLPPEQPLRGRVANEAGVAVAGATVRASDATDYGFIWWSSTTDAEGRFAWTAAPISEMQVWVSSGERTGRLFRLQSSKDEQLLTLPTQISENVRVTGKVTDASTGAAVAKFRVGISHQSTAERLDPPTRFVDGMQGTFEVQMSPSEVHMGNRTAWGLRIEAEGFDPTCTRMYDFAEGDQQLEIALQPGGTIEGLVLTPAGGPAASAQLAFVSGHDPVLTSSPGQISSRYRSGTSDANGQFQLAKPVELQALAVFHDSGWAVFPLSKSARNLQIQLLPWGRIEGTVFNGPTPVVGEQVALQKLVWSWSDAWSPLYSATTDNQGHFVFEKVPAGEFQISLEARSWQRRGPMVKALETPVRVAAGETQSLQLGTSGSQVIAHLRGSPTAPSLPLANALAIRRGDVTGPPEPAQSDYVSFTSLYAARDRYIRDPQVLAKAREVRNYIGTLASDGTVTFENIPSGRYVLDVQLFGKPDARQPQRSTEDEPVAARIRAPVFVPEGADRTENPSVSIGDFTIEPQ
jgi:RNA polymerase sigma factor (sigma-70 family)